MLKIVSLAITLILVPTRLHPSTAYDQSGDINSKAIESELLTSHAEYGNCITHAVDACGAWNADYIKPERHGPTLHQTLDWIAAQLTKKGLVYQFYHQGCAVALDQTEGSPVTKMWQEEQSGKKTIKQQSLFNSQVIAESVSGNGYTTFFTKDYHENGSLHHPKRLTFYNDAVLMNLSKIMEIKNYVGTREDGSLFLVRPNSLKINFMMSAEGINIVGAGFTSATTALVDGPVPYAFSNTPQEIYGRTYIPFETIGPHQQFMLTLQEGDIEFNIKVLKAFLHAISLCSLEE